MTPKLTFLLALLVLTSTLFGCSKPDTTRDANSEAVRQQKVKQAFENNPHISPQARAAMLQYEQARQAGRPKLGK